VLVDGGFETEGAAGTGFTTSTAWIPCTIPQPLASGTPYPASTASPTAITADVISGSSPTFGVGPYPGVGGSPTPIATVSPAPHTGTYAALTYTGGGAALQTFAPATAAKSSPKGANGICQSFTVPTNAMFTVYVNEGGYETSGGGQEGQIFAGPLSSIATATPIALFSDFAVQGSGTPTNTNGYVLKSADLTMSPYASSITPGSTATIFLGTYDISPNSKYGMYMFIDDVSVFGTPVSSSMARRRSFGQSYRR
jgi:hypothetical protein